MMKTQYTEYWKILNMFEDYINGGLKREHPGPPAAGMSQVIEDISNCTGCTLSASRKNTVPGNGTLKPKVLVIGTSPDSEEDSCGKPFPGSSGDYLKKWFGAIGLSITDHIFITNILKCRIPDNTNPQASQISACFCYLKNQIEILKPSAILTLGEVPFQVLSGTNQSINQVRGSIHDFKKIPLIPTHHPAFVLENPEYRSDVWSDLKRLQEALKINQYE